MRMFKNVDEYWFTRKATKTLFSPEISHGKRGDSWILCESIWLRCFFSPRAYPSEGKLALLKAHHAKCAMNAIGVCAHIYGNVQTKKHIFHAFLSLYEFKYKVKRGLIVWMLVVRSKLQSNSQLFQNRFEYLRILSTSSRHQLWFSIRTVKIKLRNIEFGSHSK